MRLGGAHRARIRSGIARRVVAVGLVAIAAVLVVGNAPVEASETTKRLWAVTRDAEGRLQIVRGLDAAVASMDNRIGRPSAKVLTMEEDQQVRALWTNDALRSSQWGINKLNWESAWATSKGDGVVVAVVDTGVLGVHQDLTGKLVPGTDLAADAAQYDPWGTGAVDPGGHGTHVAGVIAARTNNGVGVAGAAPNAKIMPIRVLTAQGTGVSSDVAEGIIWAVDHGADVVNLSLGGGPSAGMQLAIQYARDREVVTFAAGGNNYEAGNLPTYPAAYPEAVAVAAVNESFNRAAFSNTGSYIDVSAPGEYILSTYGQGATQYAAMNGTSMATPFAAAVAALMKSANPGLTADDLISALKGSTVNLGPPGRDSWYGYGLINPRNALLESSPLKINKGTKGNGYWIATVDGRVYAYGAGVHHYGDLRGKALSAAVVAAARTQTGKGYWLAGADGAVYAFGDAKYKGSMRGRRLNSPIVGMAAMPTGDGYILLGRDGGIFTFGSAKFYGSTGSIKLNAPVRDLTITSDGKGYWFVAADGGVFSYGNATFHGSTGSLKLRKPVRSMTAAANGKGYWMVADDGGIFAFDVPFVGSLPGARSLYGWPYVSSVRMRALPSSDGYYILGIDGTVWAMGNARYFGSLKGVWAADLMQAP
jgi:subtilisin family serine protease